MVVERKVESMYVYMLQLLSFFKELAFIVGGFFPGREGRERMVAPYAIDKELIGDPVFSEFARAACPFMMPGIYPQDPDVNKYYIKY